jgi:cytidylate kinase
MSKLNVLVDTQQKTLFSNEGGIAMAVITISRQFGSGGEVIAHKVAESLGYDYVDKELIVEVAQEAHTEESEVSRFDERGRHPIRHFLKRYLIGERRVIRAWPTYYWSDELEVRSVREGNTSISSVSCRKLFESVIQKLWERGNVVIVGRGAEIVLAGRPGVLSVCIVAPLAYRLQRVMQEQGLEHDDAIKHIKQIDKQRARYIKQNYGVNWDKPELYQLILDTEKISEETATQIICQAVSEFD